MQIKTAAMILAILGLSGAASAEVITGLTANNRLMNFDSTTMQTIGGPLAIGNLQPGETILGIDYRPLNGQLYGIGSSNRFYVINTSTGNATQIGGQFGTPLVGPAGQALRVAIDFNPNADALRVVTNSGQNTAVNVTTGVQTVQTALTYAVGDINAGAAPRIVAAAYNNNVAGTPTTRLFTIDSALDILAVQNSGFGNGRQSTVGELLLDTDDVFGFDISPSGTAFAAYNVSGFPNSTLYQIDTVTGEAHFLGGIDFSERFVDIAAVIPTPSALGLLACAGVFASRRRR
jgi:hypothetical protein